MHFSPRVPTIHQNALIVYLLHHTFEFGWTRGSDSKKIRDSKVSPLVLLIINKTSLVRSRPSGFLRFDLSIYPLLIPVPTLFYFGTKPLQKEMTTDTLNTINEFVKFEVNVIDI